MIRRGHIARFRFLIFHEAASQLWCLSARLPHLLLQKRESSMKSARYRCSVRLAISATVLALAAPMSAGPRSRTDARSAPAAGFRVEQFTPADIARPDDTISVVFSSDMVSTKTLT